MRKIYLLAFLTVLIPTVVFGYSAKKNDTLCGLAKKFGFSCQELISQNPQIENPDLIIVGQEINTPEMIGGFSNPFSNPQQYSRWDDDGTYITPYNSRTVKLYGVHPVTDNTYDVGASSTQWRYGNFQGGLLIADGSTTGTLLKDSITLGQTTNYNQGKFFVDASGNWSATGTFGYHLIPSGDLLWDMGSAGARVRNLYVATIDLTGVAVNPLEVSDGSTTSTLSKNSFNVAQTSSALSGLFVVDSTGGLSTSGTLFSYGNYAGDLKPSSQNLYDVGTTSTPLQWRYGNFNQGVLVANGSTTSTISPTTFTATTAGAVSSTSFTGSSLTLDSGTGYNSGTFNVNQAGNVYTSGTVYSSAAVGFRGIINCGYGGASLPCLSFYPDVNTGFYNANDDAIYVSAGGSLKGSLATASAFDFVNPYNAVSLNIRGGIANDATAVGVVISGNWNSLATAGAKIVQFNNYYSGGAARAFIGVNGELAGAVATGYNAGKFYVDSSGNVNASGTIQTGLGTTSGTSTIWAGNLTGGIGQFCMGDSDGVGAHCYFDVNGTLGSVATSTY